MSISKDEISYYLHLLPYSAFFDANVDVITHLHRVQRDVIFSRLASALRQGNASGDLKLHYSYSPLNGVHIKYS